jgi:hypothetical protein
MKLAHAPSGTARVVRLTQPGSAGRLRLRVQQGRILIEFSAIQPGKRTDSGAYIQGGITDHGQLFWIQCMI